MAGPFSQRNEQRTSVKHGSGVLLTTITIRVSRYPALASTPAGNASIPFLI
jgi:hypothetical protein